MQTENDSIYIQPEGKSTDDTVVFPHLLVYFALENKPFGQEFTPVTQPGILAPQGVLLQLPGGKWKECGVSSSTHWEKMGSMIWIDRCKRSNTAVS